MKRKMYPTDRVVIGNDAGDADSIVSAIALSYIESTYRNGSQATPFVSIPRESFENERPEVNLLFKLAGLHDVVNELLYIQDLTEMLQGTASTQLDFTLVDQNTLNPALKRYKSQVNVVEIVDHHEDKGESIGTCHATNRTIAFDRGVALVASSCTLVVERLKSLCNADASCVYPEPLATLLIGVILIDSVNLDESIGKVTQRDRDAVVELIQHTEWKPCESKSYLVTGSNGYMYVDTGILFDTLQRAKYENSFWNNIAVERALAYDYKEFDAGLDRQNRGIFGIASILMPGSEFIAKEDFALQTLEFMRTNQLSFLAIMFAYYDSESGDTLSRQLGFCVDQTIELDSLVNDMLSSQAYKDANLGLKQVDGMPFERSDDGLHFYLFNQENVKPSRKQIGPMLEEVYEHYLMSR
jgi:exopolyphosphatase